MKTYDPADKAQKEFHLMLMKKNEELQNETHIAMKLKPLIFSGKSKMGRYMKIFTFMMLFTGLAIVLNSCVGGYVASEPSVVYYERPQQPHVSYVWIDGDWNWNYQSHVYVQRAGYWEKPRPDHSYVSGHWQSSDHGKSWSKGYWEKNKHQDNGNHNNKNNSKNNKSNRNHSTY